MSDARRDEAFTQLFAQHEARLRAVAFSMVPHHADAEDVLQQANIVLWEKFSQFEPGSSFMSWAGRILFLEAQNFRRRSAQRRLRFGDEFLNAIGREVAPSGCPDDVAERERLLIQCVESLRPDDQLLLHARYEQRQPVEQIAAARGKRADAVYNQLSRLRRWLHDCVTRRMQEEEASG